MDSAPGQEDAIGTPNRMELGSGGPKWRTFPWLRSEQREVLSTARKLFAATFATDPFQLFLLMKDVRKALQ